MPRFARPIAVVLAVVLLLSASGAATRCLEADGTTRVELFASGSCCAAAPEHAEGPPGVAPPPACGACDDRPLGDAGWPRPTSAPLDGLLLLPPGPPAGLAPPAPAPSAPAAGDRRATAPPRAARPATLRC